MDRQQVIFESSPAFILVCLLLGIGYAFLLYSAKHPWSRTMNRVLFAVRAALAFLLAFLLLGPIVKQITSEIEKPLFVILRDNSESVTETTDSVALGRLEQALHTTRQALEDKGYNVVETDLAGNESDTWTFAETQSNLTDGLRRVTSRYEGQNIAGVIFVSDGIFNAGLSPAYASFNFPVHSVGVGDTTQRTDLALRNVAYNKIAYEGNKFPVRAEVLLGGVTNQDVTVSLIHRGKVLDKQTRNSGNNQVITFDFQPLAEEQGIQKLDVQVEVLRGEYNIKNNKSSIFVEVVSGKKKILVVAPAPHPDIKALRAVIEKNSNYEFLLHIPGLHEQQPATLRPEDIDLVIFDQAPDLRGRTRDVFQKFVQSKSSLLLLLGSQSDLQALARANMPIQFQTPPRDFDQVTPITNLNFSNFTLSADVNTIVPEFPPVTVHFGKMQIPLSATPLLFQKVGSVTTDKPLLAVDIQNDRKIGLMLGEGFWRWRLHEYEKTETTTAFDELFGKLMQFLSTTDDRRRFRSYPVKQEFSDTEAVVFESQVYNDIFEPTYGNTITIELTNDAGKRTEYAYATSPGNTRYQIGGLAEGVYRYRAHTDMNGKDEEVRGEFAVVERLIELQNLTADFNLLRKVSFNTGGSFYKAANVGELTQALQQTEATGVIHSQEVYDALINLKWVFFVLVLIAGTEWFCGNTTGRISATYLVSLISSTHRR
ncbi:MAG: hypothetical protein HC859_08050 [Bacteroidia bacterium]|nr:hypothetical protein [Bacteroidia bacterium]